MTRYIRLSEACHQASMARGTLRRYLLRGDIKGNKIGPRGDWRVNEDSLHQFLRGASSTRARDIVRSLKM